MIEKVLIPTDFSEHARRVLDCITGIPEVREIILLHVIEDIRIRVPMGEETVEALVKSAADYSLQTEKRYLETLNPDLKVTLDLTTSSDIAKVILETAEKKGVDLIVIGAYGRNIRVGVLLGSVSTAVLCRISGTNVLIMRHKIIETLTGKTYEKFCPMIFSRILCPTDFSQYSESAIALASITKGVGEVILLHVVSQDETASEIQEAVRTAEVQIGIIRDNLAAKGIQSRAIVKTGHPASEIAGIAEEEDVSVIWMSSYGKGCFHDFFLGSTVHDVVMNSKRPVIIIRAPK